MLNEFLVLGQIPGTNFQITFDELLVTFIIAAVLGVTFPLYKNRLFARYLKRRIFLARLQVQLFIESKKSRQLSLPL